MRPFLVASVIALLGVGSTAHAGRYFQQQRQSTTEKQRQAALRAQQDEAKQHELSNGQNRNERNNRFMRQFRAPAQQGMRPYSSQAVVAGTKVMGYKVRTIVPLAVRLGGSRGFGRTTASFFRTSRAGNGPVFGFRPRVVTAWRNESGPELFAFNRY